MLKTVVVTAMPSANAPTARRLTSGDRHVTRNA
jgi:hypothetical protein